MLYVPGRSRSCATARAPENELKTSCARVGCPDMPQRVRPGRLRARPGLLLGMPLIVVVLRAVTAGRADALTCDHGVTHGLFSAADAPSACWRPYGPRSPFNKQIPDRAPSAADSRAIVEHMVRYGYEFGYKSHRFQLGSQGTRAGTGRARTSPWSPSTARITGGPVPARARTASSSTGSGFTSPPVRSPSNNGMVT